MSMHQISVFLGNRPGELNKMTHVLAEGGVNMRALSLAETTDFGIARMIVDDEEKAIEVLKQADFVARITEVLAYEISDEKGGLNKLLELFTESGINIEYMYSCIIGKKDAKAYMIFRVSDTAAAEATLAGKGVKALDVRAD
ncbi:MAG: acetolactate synthase [Oscillospiraceae bacterium]|nr:acetolactate synthase [Oscillospiraceae bacterium]